VIEDWRREFPDLPHEPQDLDLIRQCLARTPAERLACLVQAARWLESARGGVWLGASRAADADRSE
jgi:hypothetical protein